MRRGFCRGRGSPVPRARLSTGGTRSLMFWSLRFGFKSRCVFVLYCLCSSDVQGYRALAKSHIVFQMQTRNASACLRSRFGSHQRAFLPRTAGFSFDRVRLALVPEELADHTSSADAGTGSSGVVGETPPCRGSPGCPVPTWPGHSKPPALACTLPQAPSCCPRQPLAHGDEDSFFPDKTLVCHVRIKIPFPPAPVVPQLPALSQMSPKCLPCKLLLGDVGKTALCEVWSSFVQLEPREGPCARRA